MRDGDGRGRHTTTASALYELPGGIRVIDTPGIRRFSVDDDDPAAIAAGFTEFAPLAAGCRYRDCSHMHEPGCAVVRAVEDGAIPRSRYESYRKLLGGDGDDADVARDARVRPRLTARGRRGRDTTPRAPYADEGRRGSAPRRPSGAADPPRAVLRRGGRPRVSYFAFARFAATKSQLTSLSKNVCV